MRFLIAETTWNTVALAHSLNATGMLLTRCDDAAELQHYAHVGRHDLMVFDAKLLGDQLSLATLRRALPDAAIALLADRATPERIAEWLDAGADTVIDGAAPQPEIVARLQAVARRRLGAAQPQIAVGPLRLDLAQRRAWLCGDRLTLSPKLYEILECLALRPARLVSKDMLLTQLYGLENEPSARVFDVYVCKLRALLAPAAGAIEIETARGSGYRLCLRDAAERDAATAEPQREAA